MATDDDNSDSSKVINRAFEILDGDLWPLAIGFLIGRAWVELPDPIASKVAVIVESTATFIILLLLVVFLIAVGVLLAYMLYHKLF